MEKVRPLHHSSLFQKQNDLRRRKIRTGWKGNQGIEGKKGWNIRKEIKQRSENEFLKNFDDELRKLEADKERWLGIIERASSFAAPKTSAVSGLTAWGNDFYC